MSQIVYLAKEILKDKILLENGALLYFKELEELFSQHQVKIWFQNQEISSTIKEKIRFLSILKKKDRWSFLIQELEEKKNLKEVLSEIQFFLFVFTYYENNFQLKKTLKKLNLTEKDLKEILEKNNFSKDFFIS